MANYHLFIFFCFQHNNQCWSESHSINDLKSFSTCWLHTRIFQLPLIVKLYRGCSSSHHCQEKLLFMRENFLLLMRSSQIAMKNKKTDQKAKVEELSRMNKNLRSESRRNRLNECVVVNVCVALRYFTISIAHLMCFCYFVSDLRQLNSVKMSVCFFPIVKGPTLENRERI